MIVLFKHVKGGGVVKAIQILSHDFELFVGGNDLDMYQQFEGGFVSMRAILPMWASTS